MAARPVDRLEFAIDRHLVVVRVRLAKARQGLAELQVCRRDGEVVAAYPFGTPDREQLQPVSIDLSELMHDHGLQESSNLYLSWSRTTKTTGTKTVRQRLGGFSETVRPPAAQRAVIDGRQVRLDVTVKGNLALRIDDDPGTGPRLSTADIRVDRGVVELTADLKTHNATVRAATTVVSGRTSGTRVALPASYVHDEAASRHDNGLLHFRVVPRLDLAVVARALPDADELVDLSLEVTLEGRDEPYVLPFRFQEDFSERELTTTTLEEGDRTHLFLPYLTYRTQKLAYRTERLRTEDHRYLRRLLLVAWLFPLVKPFTRIWLIGELPYRAQDNGFHFFRWLRTERPRRRAFYVIDPGSPDRDKLLPLGNVIDRGSRRHLLYSLLASRLVSSHHAEYLFASRDPAVVRWTRGVRVFLQHGVTAAKNVTPIYARQQTLELPTERFLVASELERRIVMEDYGYRPSQVVVTGFARFDTLFSAPQPREACVLIMPTWREGLRAVNFTETDYHRHWHGLLTHPDFQRLLEGDGLRAKLVLHPNLRTFAEFFDVENVQLVGQDEADVQQLLTTSSMLVTDFSSVAWDFSFLDRPVVYFQFDPEVLTGARAPHIDFATQLPGPVLTDVDDVAAEVCRVVGRGGTMEETYRSRAGAFLDHRDQRSCERIEAAVSRAWRPSTAFDRLRNARPVQRRWWSFRTGPRYHVWMQRLFRLAAALPRTNEVVFECDRGRHFGDAPRYLYERLAERENRPDILWANNTTLRLTAPRTRKIRRHSPTYYWRLGRAGYWINNQNFPPDLVKPARTRFLQTWHGTPLKRMQHDVEKMAGRDEDYQERAARLTSYWDVLLSGSAYATACFRSAFRFTGEILEQGYPRNDVFSWPDAAARTRAARERLGLVDHHRKIVLYAPTFRDDNRPDANWRHELHLDVPRLADALGDDHVLLVRFHPLVRESMGPLIAAHPGFVIDASTYDDIQELMLISDVLITDYSSVFFDYSVLQRPILFFTYDLDHYRDDLRGFYLDLETSAPGPLLPDNDALLAALTDLDRVHEQYADRLREFRDTYAPRDDGGASDRVLDAFFGHEVDASSPEVAS